MVVVCMLSSDLWEVNSVAFSFETVVVSLKFLSVIASISKSSLSLGLTAAIGPIISVDSSKIDENVVVASGISFDWSSESSPELSAMGFAPVLVPPLMKPLCGTRCCCRSSTF